MPLLLDHDRLFVATSAGLRAFDVSGGTPQQVASAPVAAAGALARCDAFVAALAPSGDATSHEISLLRLDDLAPLGTVAAGAHVDRRSLVVTPDGARLAYVSWETGAVVVVDAAGKPIAASQVTGGPSGLAASPDGRTLLAGFTDQGSGALWLFAFDSAAGLTPTRLADPSPSAGLDDAPFFSTFDATGTRALVTNASWGGRGLYVYDVETRKPLWSRVDPGESSEEEGAGDENDAWFAHAAGFAAGDSLVFLAGPEGLRAFDAHAGAERGAVAVNADVREGFAVDEPRRLVWWLANGEPFATPWPEAGEKA